MSVYNIPQWMRERNQWMVASEDKRPMRQSPIDPEQLIYGAKNDPSQWMSFGDALYLAGEHGLRMGYVNSLDDHVTIIDLDNLGNANLSKKPNDADTLAYQDYIIGLTIENGWYIESSQSGYGAHIVVGGKLERDTNCGGIEFYGHNGFVVMTGLNAQGQIKRLADEQAVSFNALIKERGAAPVDIEQYGADFVKRMSAPYSDIEREEMLDHWSKVFRFNDRYVALERGEDLDATGKGLTTGEWRAGASERDADLLQGIYKMLKGWPERDLVALRVFQTSERWHKRKHRKVDPAQYLITRTLGFVKGRVLAEEESERQWSQAADNLRAEALAKQQPVIESPVPQLAPIVNAPVAPSQKQAPEIQFLTASQLKASKPTDWLIKNLLIHEGIACVYGESGSGKSFLMLDMIAAIAEGQEKWFNNRIKRQVPVCCLALEGQGGLRKRVLSWEKGHTRDFPESVLFYTGDFSLRGRDLADVGNRERLQAFCRALNKNGLFGGLIVIDTLAQASNGADENSAKDMNGLIDGMKMLRHATGSTVLVVHHAKKAMSEDGSSEARGSSVLKAAMDAEIEVSRSMVVFKETENERTCRGWIARKVKDAADGIEAPFDLLDAQLGFDSDMEMETGKYVQPIMVENVVVDESSGEILQVKAVPEMERGKQRADGKGKRPGTPKRGAPARAGSSEAPVGMNGPPGGMTWKPGEKADPTNVPGGRGRPKGGGAQQQRIVEAIRAACVANGGPIQYELAQMAVDALSPSGAHQAIKNMTRAFSKLIEEGELFEVKGNSVSLKG